jgi:competence ComEA-like helix-hairpin-helix protein
MRNFTHELYEYFYFTRTERNASIALSFLCLFFFLLPNFYTYVFPPPPPTDFSEFRAAILAVTSDQPIVENDVVGVRTNFRGETPVTVPVELFQFDPNTATKEELVRLGLSPRTANTLINFRSKGGLFFKKEDLKKVYGLRPEDYERLERWIMIEKKSIDVSKEGSAADENRPQSPKTEKLSEPFYSKKEYVPTNVDINQATAEEWQQLSGIGPSFSNRIVKFRDKLGGFASVEQVGETYGLPDSVFQKISPYLTISAVYKKILVNKCSLDELKAHPYINSYQATILFNYRKQHGDFTSFADLKKIKAGFKDEDWERLEAYLSFEK